MAEMGEFLLLTPANAAQNGIVRHAKPIKIRLYIALLSQLEEVVLLTLESSANAW